MATQWPLKEEVSTRQEVSFSSDPVSACAMLTLRQGQTGPSVMRDCSTDVSHIPSLTGPPSKSTLQTDGYSQFELNTDSCRLGASSTHVALYRCVQSIWCMWARTLTQTLNLKHWKKKLYFDIGNPASFGGGAKPWVGKPRPMFY